MGTTSEIPEGLRGGLKKCGICKKNKKNVGRKKIFIPQINQYATSQPEMCPGCFEQIQALVESQK